MRIKVPHQNSYAKIILFILASVITSCNSLKRVEDHELLIANNTILIDSIKVSDEAIESLIAQKPNSDILGYNWRLNLYNLAKVNPDKQYQEWLYKKPKRKERLTKILSEKQVKRLGESFLVKRLSKWLKKIGEAPVVLDSSKTIKSLQRLSAYFGTKGYFNNTTTFTIDSLKKKQRVNVNYKITLGDPYMIDTIQYKITSPQIDSIYKIIKKDSYIKIGQQFDSENFNKERERLTASFRDRGVFNFQESAISFDLISDTTRLGNDRQMNIKLNIDDLKTRTKNSITTSKFKVFKFDKINIYTDQSKSQLKRFKNYNIYYKDKLKFKPETLTNAIFFVKDSVYRDTSRSRTLRQLSSLNVFRFPTVNFETDTTTNKLTANIYLTERPKYSFRTNLDITHSNIQTIGLSFSPSLQWRNLFKGAENLSLSGRINIGSSSQEIDDRRFFNLFEFGADLKLDFPRIWFPFIKTEKLIPNYMLPRTSASIGFGSQKNIGLDKRTLNATLSYNWNPSDYRKNNFELLNIEFVKNLKPEQFFNVYRNTYQRLDNLADNYDEPDEYESLEEYQKFEGFFEPDPDNPGDPRLNTETGAFGFLEAKLNDGFMGFSQNDTREAIGIIERGARLTQENLILASNYTYHKNNRQGLADNNFYKFRWKIETAGNLLAGLSDLLKFNSDEDGKKLFLNVPFSQYVKTEFDFVKYWELKKSGVLAFRSFFGIAIPYGNSDNIPFARSYFGGGSNDNRAWAPYSLGPGKAENLFEFNEANLKIALNLEYRFPLFGNFNGAIFADAGNIWNVFDDSNLPGSKFTSIDSLGDIALGTGLGIRYDFTYFLFRLDLGFKTYNPVEEVSKRWFRDYNLSNSVLQIGINYPF